MKFYSLAVLVYFLQRLSTMITQTISDSQELFDTCGCSAINTSKTVCSLKLRPESNEPLCVVIFERLQDNFKNVHVSCMRRNTFLVIEETGGPFFNIRFQCFAKTRLTFGFDGPVPHPTLQLSFYRQKYTSYTNGHWELRGNMRSEAGISGRYTVKTDVERENATVHQVFFDVYVKYVKGGPFLKHYNSTLAPIILNRTTFVLPCKVLIQGLHVELKKDGVVFNAFKSYKPKIGFFIDVVHENLDHFFGEYQCSPKIIISKAVDTVRIKVDSRTLNPMTENYEQTDAELLNFKLSEILSTCSSIKEDADYYQLVNLKLRNPAELPFKIDCLVSGNKCLGKEEANSSVCARPFRSCKSLGITEGGGIISCFKANDFINSKTVHEYILGLNGILYTDPNQQIIPVDALLRIEVSGSGGENICTNVAYNISCVGVSYLLAQPLELSVVFPNQSTLDSFRNEKKFIHVFSNLLRISTQVSMKHEGIITVLCTALWWNSENGLKKSVVFKTVGMQTAK